MSTSPISDELLIDKFLSDTLSAEERLLFIERKETETFKVMLEEAVIRQLGRQQLKEKLKNISISQREKTPVRRFNKYYKIFIATAAIAILLFSVSIFLEIGNTVIDIDQLYKNYYEPYPNVYSSKSSNKDSITTLDKALQLYDEESYANAISTFEKIISESKTNDNITFYYAQSLLANNRFQAAQVEFRKITEKHLFYNEAQWYLGLIFLKQDSLEKTRHVYKELLPLVGAIKQRKITELLKQTEK